MIYFFTNQLAVTFKYLCYRSATLASTATYPPGYRIVDGKSFGLERIGHMAADSSTVDQIRSLKEALALLLRPDETYLDLTNRNALYYYLDLPIHQLYGPYIAASEKMQNA